MYFLRSQDSVARAYFRQMDPERRGRLAFADWKRGSDGLDRDTAKVRAHECVGARARVGVC